MKIVGKIIYSLDQWVSGFKYYCCPSCLKLLSIPKAAKVILFLGMPNSPEAITGNSGTWYRHIQLYPWIKGYWVE